MTRSLHRYTSQGGRRTMIHPVTAEAAYRRFGRTPSHGLLFHDASSPATGAFGGEDLAQSAAIGGWRVSTPYPNKLAARFTDGSTSKLQAGAVATFDDDGVTSQAWLFHILNVTDPATTRAIIGKTDGTTGWYVALNSINNCLLVSDDGITQKITTAVGDHAVAGRDLWGVVAFDRTADLQRIRTRVNSSSTDISVSGSLAATASMQAGRVEVPINSAGFDLAALYWFQNANAEGDWAETMRQAARYAGG